MHTKTLFKLGEKQNLLTIDFSEETLEKLTTLYPFSANREKTVANFKRELINKLPKTDLHVHGEAGCIISVELARSLADKINVSFPEYLVDEKNTWKYRGKEDFSIFLDDFLTISSLIQTPEDVEAVAYDFYRNCYENNVIFSLLGISWVQCKDKMTFAEFNAAYNRAILRGMKEFGDVSVLRLRYYLERHVHDQDLLTEIVEHLESKPNPLITTIGLAGGEENHPLSDFKTYYEVFKKLRKDANFPFYFLTAHMEAHSDYKEIEKSLELLDWIAHGRKAADNSETIEKMRQNGISFEACPLSDVYVYPGIIPSLAEHKQFKILIENDLASLNSDDPGFFGDVNEVYLQVFEALELSISQLLQCTSKGINPVSPTALNELENNKPEQYKNYMEIKQVGELKIQFFVAYCELLALLASADLEKNQIEKLFAIDLKTTRKELSALKKEIPEQFSEKLDSLITIKRNIEFLTQSIIEKTEAMINTYEKTIHQTMKAECSH